MLELIVGTGIIALIFALIYINIGKNEKDHNNDDGEDKNYVDDYNIKNFWSRFLFLSLTFIMILVMLYLMINSKTITTTSIVDENSTLITNSTQITEPDSSTKEFLPIVFYGVLIVFLILFIVSCFMLIWNIYVLIQAKKSEKRGF